MTSSKTETHLSQNPIFIVGYPRSGTTLLQALLATQGDLVTFPETHFFRAVFGGNNEFRETVDLKTAEALLEDISGKSGITFEGHLIDGLTNKSDAIFIKDFFEAVVRKLLPDGTAFSQRWLEKTPDHCLYMEQIARYYPEAKFVGIVRNPFFAINSRIKNFPPQARDPLKFVATQWVQRLNAFEDFAAKNPSKTIMVRYEDLTADHEGCISRICQFLEIDFDPGKLRNYQQKANGVIQPFEHWKRDVKGSQIFTRNDTPKSFFSVRDVLKIQSIVLEKMKNYGYEPQHPLMQRIYNLIRIA